MGSGVVEDAGDYWRAVNPRGISPVQTLKWVDGRGQDTRIRYAMGVDPMSGQTGIAYVDYPKDVWTRDDVLNSDVVDKFFARCQICAAVDQIKDVRSSPAADTSMPPEERQYHQQYQSLPPASPGRVSAGQAMSSLPKYLPTAIQLTKKLLLSSLGDAAASVVLSFAADAASGLSPDPNYRRAMQSLSDSLVDDINIDDKFVDAVRQDVSRLADAYSRDGNLISAVKTSMIKTPAELVAPLDRYPVHRPPGYQQTRTYSYQPKLASDRLSPSRVID